jgi:hypothetical protein
MSVDGDKIVAYLRDHGIDTVDRGPDVSRSNINMKCPFCGDDDEGKHMGINLETGYYGCWRNSRHSGRDVSFLLTYITKESVSSIRRNIGSDTTLSESDDVDMLKILSKDLDEDDDVERVVGGVRSLTLDKSFMPMWKKGYKRGLYLKYLEYRGFDEVEDLSYVFGLHYCLYGEWKYRIIFPIYFKDKIVSWVGRTIHKDEPKHYVDLSVIKSIRAPKFCLYNYDMIKSGGSTLFITEGIIDCLKIKWFIDYKYKCESTCLFTNSMTDEQRELLWKVGRKYDEVAVMLDADALSNALNIQSQLSTFLNNVTVRTMPSRYNDPGQMSGSYIQKNLSRSSRQHGETKTSKHEPGVYVRRVEREDIY